jgi:hypothetical protein
VTTTTTGRTNVYRRPSSLTIKLESMQATTTPSTAEYTSHFGCKHGVFHKKLSGHTADYYVSVVGFETSLSTGSSGAPLIIIKHERRSNLVRVPCVSCQFAAILHEYTYIRVRLFTYMQLNRISPAEFIGPNWLGLAQPSPVLLSSS